MHTVEPEPWALGVRLRDEPEGVQRLTVQPGSAADGCTIKDLADLPGHAWISLVVRDGQAMPVRGGTELLAGDELLILADPDTHEEVAAPFERP